MTSYSMFFYSCAVIVRSFFIATSVLLHFIFIQGTYNIDMDITFSFLNYKLNFRKVTDNKASTRLLSELSTGIVVSNHQQANLPKLGGK